MALNIQQSIFSEVAEFLVSRPSLETLAEYQAPDAAQERVALLLEKNREEGLTPDEREEMDQYLTISHLLTLMKAKARLKLAGKE
jgi:hypothetical protein